MNPNDPNYEFFNQLALQLESAIPGSLVNVVPTLKNYDVQLFHGESNFKGSYLIFPPEIRANGKYRKLLFENVEALMKEAYLKYIQSPTIADFLNNEKTPN